MENEEHPRNAAPIDQSPARFIRLRTVLDWVGMQKSWIYREMAAGRFVRSYKLGGATVWDAEAVQDWIRRRLARERFQ